jgi:hypothetical protein
MPLRRGLLGEEAQADGQKEAKDDAFLHDQ